MPPAVPRTAYLLAAVAGCVDAVGYLQLGGFFVSFMSGNSTRLGIALGNGERTTVLFLLGLIVLFVGGAALGELLGRAAGQRRLAALLALDAGLLAIAALLFDLGRPLAAIPLMVAGMGAANAALARNDGPAFGVTYMSGTLVRLGRDLVDPAGREAVAGTLLLWIMLVAGVAFGTVGFERFGGAVLRVPALLLLAGALFHWRDRSPPSQ